jgi:hypothetical protein
MDWVAALGGLRQSRELYRGDRLGLGMGTSANGGANGEGFTAIALNISGENQEGSNGFESAAVIATFGSGEVTSADTPVLG